MSKVCAVARIATLLIGSGIENYDDAIVAKRSVFCWC